MCTFELERFQRVQKLYMGLPAGRPRSLMYIMPMVYNTVWLPTSLPLLLYLILPGE